MAGRLVARDDGRFLTTDIGRGSPPNPRMQPTGRGGAGLRCGRSHLRALIPAEQLWVIALAVKENGGPTEYVSALRHMAERLEELGWWLSEQGGQADFRRV